MSGRAQQNLLGILGPKDGWQCGDFHRRPGCSNGPDFYRIFPDRIVGIEHFAIEKGIKVAKKSGKYQNLKHGVEKARTNATATMSDDGIREAGIAVHKAVWDNSFKGAALGDGDMWSSLEHSMTGR